MTATAGERVCPVRRPFSLLAAPHREAQMRQLCHFYRADEDYGKRVAKELGIDVSEVMSALEHPRK